MGEGRGDSRSSDKAQLIQNKDEQAENKALVSHTGCGVRHSLALWAFLGFANLFILRIDMSIALVAMATQNSTASGSNSSHARGADNVTECQSDDASTATAKAPAEFDWSNTLQGFILSAFYYGYFATQILGGMLARRVGGKNLFTLSLAGCSALALLTPISARFHVGLLIAVRVLQGCLQGIVFPAMQVVLSKWAPAEERSRFVAFTYAGCQAGTVVGMLSAGYLCDTSIGWPIVFYIEGVLGLLWCVGWMLFTSESPLHHSRITETEKRYIESSVDRPQQQELQTPWRSILTSPALYAIAAAHFANDWGCFAVMTCLPKFMKDILYYDLTQNGVLTSLPYLVTWVCNFIAGALADFLRKPNRLRTVHVRKIMVCMGLLGPASLLLAAAYFPGCGRVAVVVLLTVAMGFSGFTVAGHTVNHLDIAPPFAGIMFAMTNTFGTTSGFIGPALAGALTNHHDTRQSWQTFFLISGAIYACGGSIFVLFARGDVQPWARVKDTDIDSILPDPGYGSVQAHPQQEEDDEGKDSNDGRLTS